jgi:long-chain fatty acid transport protein
MLLKFDTTQVSRKLTRLRGNGLAARARLLLLSAVKRGCGGNEETSGETCHPRRFACRILRSNLFCRCWGFLNTVQSVTSAGTAGAGATAVGDDASTVWYNPAGLVLSQRSEVLISGGLSFPSTSFQNRGSTDAVGFPASGNSFTNSTASLLPSIFASLPIDDQLRVGIGVFVPFGQMSKYDSGWVGRYQVQQVSLKTIDVRPAVAYRINGMWSVGGALDVQYAKFQGATALDFGTLCFVSAACFAGPEGADGRLVAPLTTWGVGYDFGVLIEPSADLRFGINYKSGIHGGFNGNAHFNVPAMATPLTAAGAFSDTSVTSTLNFPQIVSLGAAWRIGEQWTALVDASWTQWSDIQQFTLNFANPTPAVSQPLHWHDSWRIAVGGIYRLADDTDLRAGFAFDQSPIGNQFRTALLPGADDITIGVGIRRRVSDSLEISLSYDYNREMDATLNLSQLGAGTLIGTVRQQFHTLGAQARWQF